VGDSASYKKQWGLLQGKKEKGKPWAGQGKQMWGKKGGVRRAWDWPSGRVDSSATWRVVGKRKKLNTNSSRDGVTRHYRQKGKLPVTRTGQEDG